MASTGGSILWSGLLEKHEIMKSRRPRHRRTPNTRACKRSRSLESRMASARSRSSRSASRVRWPWLSLTRSATAEHLASELQLGGASFEGGMRRSVIGFSRQGDAKRYHLDSLLARPGSGKYFTRRDPASSQEFGYRQPTSGCLLNLEYGERPLAGRYGQFIRQGF